MNEEDAKKVLNAIDFKDGDNIVIINKNVYDKMKNKKQQLIKFLENKIKECNKEIEDFLDREYYCIALDKKEAFQEVLYFVEGNEKNEKI